MAPKYLLDSNIIIYAADPAHQFLRPLIARISSAVSAVSYVEVLGYHRLTATEQQLFGQFFSNAFTLALTQDVLDVAVQLRQQRKLTLGDSLIAATALHHKLTLITRNSSDFNWITGLLVLDPFDPLALPQIF